MTKEIEKIIKAFEDYDVIEISYVNKMFKIMDGVVSENYYSFWIEKGSYWCQQEFPKKEDFYKYIKEEYPAVYKRLRKYNKY